MRSEEFITKIKENFAGSTNKKKDAAKKKVEDLVKQGIKPRTK